MEDDLYENTKQLITAVTKHLTHELEQVKQAREDFERRRKALEAKREVIDKEIQQGWDRW